MGYLCRNLTVEAWTGVCIRLSIKRYPTFAHSLVKKYLGAMRRG
jgi:hypothetical protein